MTFLPLDTITARPPDERLRMIPGAKLALDVIDYDRSVEKAMWYVTGNAVIVQTLDEAKTLAFSKQNPVHCKFVTLDACVISKTGAITGGDVTQLTSKAQKWQQKDSSLSKLKEKFTVSIKSCSYIHLIACFFVQTKPVLNTLVVDSSTLCV
jgi:structural maintenance of chromosome 1